MRKTKNGEGHRLALLLLFLVIPIIVMAVLVSVTAQRTDNCSAEEHPTKAAESHTEDTPTPTPIQVPPAAQSATETPREAEEIPSLVSVEEEVMLAQLVWGEARGCSAMEQAAVVWCVLNRVDSQHAYFPDSISEVIIQTNQFSGYNSTNPVNDDIMDVVLDVLNRWKEENDGSTNEGRVLPVEYLYFSGDGKHNYFRTEYKGGSVWSWSCDNPYKEW